MSEQPYSESALCALCPEGTDPHLFSVHLAHAERHRVVAERVIDLWNKHGGWIPGLAYKELAEVLGIDTDRLIHRDHENGVRHNPDPSDEEGMGPGSGPLRTQEEKVAFRKGFDRRVEEGQS